MSFNFVIYLWIFAIIHQVLSIPQNSLSTTSDSRCNIVCSRTYLPICAGPISWMNLDDQRQTFMNSCMLQKYNCENRTSEL